MRADVLLQTSLKYWLELRFLVHQFSTFTLVAYNVHFTVRKSVLVNRVRRRDAAEDETIPGPAELITKHYNHCLGSITIGNCSHHSSLSQLRLQRGISEQSCMPLALMVLVDIDEGGRFPENIPQPFFRIISFGALISNAFYDQKFYFQNSWQF